MKVIDVHKPHVAPLLDNTLEGHLKGLAKRTIIPNKEDPDPIHSIADTKPKRIIRKPKRFDV